METHLIHIFLWHFKGLRKISLTVGWKHTVSLVALLLSISPPCFHFSYISAPHFSLSVFLSSICPPFHPFPVFFHFTIPLLHPFLLLFYLSSPSFSTQSSIYFSVSEHYRAVRVNGVPVSSAGQVMNLSPPLMEPSDTDLFHHPARWGQDRVGWRCRSRLVWRDHHIGTSSACNVAHSESGEWRGPGQRAKLKYILLDLELFTGTHTFSI